MLNDDGDIIRARPLSAGVEVTHLDASQIRERFGFDYSENIVAEGDVKRFSSVMDERIREVRWTALCDSMSSMPQQMLAVCHLNDEVGYGVFSRVPIKAGTFVCIYSGLQEAFDPSVKPSGN